jgi:hypothetical protein
MLVLILKLKLNFMLKSFITLSIFSALFFSCQNNDSKIEELEKKIQMQNEALAKDREADLNKTVAEKDAEINSLKIKKKANNNSSYFAKGAGIFPEGSQRYLSYADIEYLSSRDLKIMRNEIFARHGYIFKTSDMIQHFSEQSWYRPLNNDVTAYLSKIEKENVNFIKQYE